MVDDQKQGGKPARPDDTSHSGGEMQQPPYMPKSEFARREEEVLKFWNTEHIFGKSLEKPAPKGEFVFYDGPPFANGKPHYGHILASAIKDAIPRYRTMQGYHVARQWGWDCHGLPVENLVEKELGFKSKRDIEEYGVAKFNAAARTSIMKDVADWQTIIPRIGRWADMSRDYKTMDATYTESVWWAFKNLYDRKLIYEGFKAMHLCPRCGTTLSNFEVAQGYQDIHDIAVTVKLPLIDEPGTSLLIWTTTPWTLPGNVAAAVNADAMYVKIRTDDGFVVLAKELAKNYFTEGDPQVHSELLGRELVGKSYEPPFPYFKDMVHKHKTHAWKVYAAPYVTLEDGTGIVHLAPAYGAEDLELAQKEKIPLIHHVGDDGRFVAAVVDFAHLPVKPKGRHMETDEKIVEVLDIRGRLFKKEIINHSYPHCWRCDTPLLNWAANSWFVNVASVKSKLLAQNESVDWVPEHVGRGRFQNGLQSAPDWAISRSRYWGAPIPVWRHSKTKEIKVIGSVDELLAMVRLSGNRYFVMRHGEARSNVEDFVNSTNDVENHLTTHGQEQARASAQDLKGMNIDMIVASPLIRAQETARIVCEELGLPPSAIMTDTRIAETRFGEKENAPMAEWQALFATLSDKFNHTVVGGETYAQVYARVGDFLFDLERRYSGKRILIVTHATPAWLMNAIAERAPHHELHNGERARILLPTASWHELAFTPYPHNEHFELDLHRPYIDDVPMGDALSGEWKRVSDVFDCWFESGSMPFASAHYPFNKTEFNPKGVLGLFAKGYPADFIAEGLDQTRGWFYSLIVLGVALFDKSPYKHVIVNGLINASDGKKMSKRLKNYPDPMEIVDKYGADSLRYYFLSSQLLRGEDLSFQERGVEEIAKKLLMRLDNVRSFYDLYAVGSQPEEYPKENSLAEPINNKKYKKLGEENRGLFRRDVLPVASSTHVLDRWILSRLGELIRDTTAGFESYELDVATRPLAGFIDDLSTWYLRRSRDRFKTARSGDAHHSGASESDDKEAALRTLRFVLSTTAHIMAPTMPFFAEDLYQRVRGEQDPLSVHLSQWPVALPVDQEVLDRMSLVRNFAAVALKQREQANIKIRQPLQTFTIKHTGAPLPREYTDILADEINVKDVVFEFGGSEVLGTLDIALTPQLREEGVLRDVVRAIQDFRKQEKLVISDRPILSVETNKAGAKFFSKYTETLVEETNLSKLLVSVGTSGDEGAPFPLTFSIEQ